MPDPSLLKELEEANRAELERLEEAITDAQENLGDTELKDALLARAEYLCKIGDKVRGREGGIVGCLYNCLWSTCTRQVVSVFSYFLGWSSECISSSL